MLLNSFFRCQTYNPYLAPEELVFSKTTAGEFSYTIPANARHVRIEIAGGNGGKAYLWDVSVGAGGRGELITILGDIVGSLAGKTITGKIGATATSSTGVGGTGYTNGGNGTHSTPGGSSSYGGGGGGSTGVVIDGTLYEASGGGGATFNDYYGGWYHSVGGKGGGTKGGAAGLVINERSATNGGNATSDQINPTDNGYIKIYINSQSSTLFEKKTFGAYSFTIPSTAKFVAIEIAGGNGSNGSGFGYSDGNDVFKSGGKGSCRVIKISNASGKTITGIIGESGGISGVAYIAGRGAQNGSNGGEAYSSRPESHSYGGGGGGSSTVVIDDKTYTVSGGAGGAVRFSSAGWAQGGAGGGAGAGQPTTNGNGGDATDGDTLNKETFGYVRVFKLG